MHLKTSMDSPRAKRPTTKKILFAWLAVFAAIGILFGFVDYSPDKEGTSNTVLAFAVFFLTFIWCRADAKEQRKAVPAGIKILAAILPPIGLPIYHYYTRKPINAAVKATIKAVLFYTIAIALNAATEFTVLFLRRLWT